MASLPQIAGNWLTGVSVVTTLDSQGSPAGLTASAVTSLSLNPPQFLICIDNTAESLAAFKASGRFCINYLSAQQQDLSETFASPLPDRFAGVEWAPGTTGVPVIGGVIAYAECKVAAEYPGGDHTILVGDLVHGDTPGGEPLAYFRAGYRRLER